MGQAFELAGLPDPRKPNTDTLTDLRLRKQLKAYENAPRYYPVSRYLDALVAGMENRPKTVVGSDADVSDPDVVLDLPLGGSSGGIK